MDGYKEKIPLVVIAGPTASGKTAAAIEAAKKLGGEIISADSMQIYRSLDIGTAKPTKDELNSARHHLIDIREPDEAYSVADFIADANAAVDAILARGKIPIVCGGTGLYISSLVSGITLSSDKTDEELRKSLYEEYEKNGIEPLLTEIREKDEEYAKNLHPNNVKRIIRAVERLRTTNLTDAEQNERSRIKPSRYEQLIFVLCPPREVLYRRIEARIDEMLKHGLLEEARTVFDNKESFKTAAQAIGYKEFFEYFKNERSLEECTDLLKQATRRYAKRQITWFKREENALWLDTAAEDAKQTANRIVARFYETFDNNEKKKGITQ